MGIKLFKILLPAVVFTPYVQNKSLTAIGMPGSFKSKFGLSSNFFALSIADEKSSVIYVFNSFAFSDRSMKALVISVEVKFLSCLKISFNQRYFFSAKFRDRIFHSLPEPDNRNCLIFILQSESAKKNTKP